jgi:glutathione synthase
MTIKIGIVMDPISQITFKKDSSLAMLMAAQKRGWEISYMEQQGLFIKDGIAFSSMRSLQVFDNQSDFFKLGQTQTQPLTKLDVILMRKDPPFDMNFIYTTYILEIAEKAGVKIVNRPQSLRDCNEKVFATHFPQCCAPTLVSQDKLQILDFIKENPISIIKPLDGMGGESIFKIEHEGSNTPVIIETLTKYGSKPAMIQRYIPEVKLGDKRILMIGGKPVSHGLARIPQGYDIRGNLAAGGRGEVQSLSEKELWICDQIGDTLLEKGLDFVGIDVIGGYLTEINVTSPTCIQEIDRDANTDIAGQLLDHIEKCIV